MKSRYNASIVVIFLVLFVCSIIVLSSWNSSYSKTSHNDVSMRMRNIVVGMLAYNSDYGTLPPAAILTSSNEPLYSWRFAILPRVENTAFIAVMGHSWRDGKNSEAHATSYPLYCFDNGNTNTNVMALTGLDTPLGDSAPRRRVDIADGTILALETNSPQVHWMEPKDIDINNLEHQEFVNAAFKEDFHVAFADGQVWILDRKTPMSKLKLFLTVSAAKLHDRNAELGPYRR